jgi:acyl-CoA dehydrogenase
VTQPDDDLRALVATLSELDEDQRWFQIVELGLVGVGVDEEAGGSGGTFADLLLIVEEFAAKGVSTPILESSMAHWALTTCGWTEAPTAADTRRTIIFHGDRFGDADEPLVLRSVPWARRSERVVVVDREGRVLDGAVASGEIEPGQNLAGEDRDTLTLSARARHTSIGTIDVTAALNRFSLLWSAAILGAVKGTYELTKRYVKTREQFGAPLIKIPAVAANLAVMRTHVLQAQAAFDRAASCAASDDMTADAELGSTAVARIITSSSADEIARIAHQLHGAIGTTEEYPLHRFTQRLWAWRDFDRTSRDWATMVGRDALRGGEQSIWVEMSAPTLYVTAGD